MTPSRHGNYIWKVIGAKIGTKISVQKRPFCDSALWHLHFYSLKTNFCYHSVRIFIMHQRNFFYSATSVAEFSHLRNILLFFYSATPVAEFSHLRNILLFCYSATPVAEFSHLRNILLFCYSATPMAECFLLEKHSTILLPEFGSSEKR